MADTQEIKRVLDEKQALLAGDASSIAKQRGAGKLTARERIGKLLDEGSFMETDAFYGDAGVITGYGTVEDRPVYVFAQDFTVHGGAMGEKQSKKICKLLDLALRTGAPVIGLCDSAGVRIDEGAKAMNAFSSVYTRMAKLSGVCPLLCVIAGPVIGGAAMIAGLADISVQVSRVGQLMVYGPTVTGALSGKNLTAEEVGGADKMAAQGGVTLTAGTEDEAISLCVKALGLLPSCNADSTELIDTDDLNRELTEAASQSADQLIQEIVDAGSFLELRAEYGKAIRTGLCRIGGHVCGLVASNPAVHDGMFCPSCAAKAAKLIALCDSFDIPVVSMIDSKGVKVPDEGHQAATIDASAALLYAYATATCGKVSVITGNAIGQAYIAMAGKENADMTFAWPGAVISALTPEAAVQVLYTEELKAGKSRAELESSFAKEVCDAVSAAREGLIDDICTPADTRKVVISALEMLSEKTDILPERKHGSIIL